MSTSTTVEAIIEALSEPFPQTEIEWKPGAVNKDRTKALALAYVDSRSYIHRLNLICPEWQDDYQVTMLADRVVVLCRLTINGVTRTGDGECLLTEGERTETNAVTSSSAQAFKRACVKFGLGAYLYSLPQTWCDYDERSRRIVNPPHLPNWALSPAERMEKATRAATEREAAERGMALDDLEPAPAQAAPAQRPAQAAPAAGAPQRPAAPAEDQDPGATVIHFGKMNGRTLAEVWKSSSDGQGWVRWCAEKFEPRDPKGQHLKRMATAFLMLNAAYAG